ncbi:MAG: ISKra4 family transposase, partial [Chloroflexi bacterium]|nr:ISKra4 family transposase [Chloroflexota bacterium]
TLIGVLHWKRRVGRCPHGCKIGQVAPLDTALGRVPQQRTSLEVKQIACALAVFVPFETAAALLHRWFDLSVAPGAVWGWAQAAGQSAMQRLQRELERLEKGKAPTAELMDAQTAAQSVLIGADGVMVPFRPAAGSPKGRVIWREVKVAILARLGRHTTRLGQVVSRLERRRLVAVLGDIEALSPRLWLETLRQGVPSAKLVAWVSDGGRGFWRLFRERFEQTATGILDFYHAAQHLWAAAAAWLDAPHAQIWFEQARHQLRHGESAALFQELAAALELKDLPAGARDALQNLSNYLDKHRAHIDYKRFKELGLPLGSGMVESACKWLIQQRFKGVGMRWSEDGFNHLLHLRLAWVNGRFDALFLSEPSPNC